MEFIDYYAVLSVSSDISATDLKKQYHTLCRVWHPDLNKSSDATTRMQEIVEAYLILSDKEAREKYDREYRVYQAYHSNSVKGRSTQQQYFYNDEELKAWINNAQRQASKIVDKLIIETGHHFKTGLKAAINEMLPFKLW